MKRLVRFVGPSRATTAEALQRRDAATAKRPLETSGAPPTATAADGPARTLAAPSATVGESTAAREA